MSVRFTFRPLPIWPHESTQNRRGSHTFSASLTDTLDVLQRELGHLDAQNAIIAAGLREEDIRLDGFPRAAARAPSHPGVEISFDSPHGRLAYATDVCARWEHNIRSIALGLGDLRAVDLHIGSQRGQQYAGYKALGAGAPSVESGRNLIRLHGSERAALIATHPDHGGDPADFADVQAARAAG